MDPAMLAAFMARMNLAPDQLLSMQGALSSGSRGLTVRRPPPSFQHDMSAEELTEFLEQYKQWFEEDRTIPAEPAPLFDRSLLISEQHRRRAEVERTLSQHGVGAGVLTFTTFVGLAKHSSQTPVQDLRPARFADMLVRQVHVGHYLLCRIIAPCSRMVAIQTMIEDVDGVAYDLSIYNFPSTSDCTLEHLDALFPVGRILALREPTFKAPMQGDRPLVRVDSPTDISFAVAGSPLLDGVVWQTGAMLPRSPTTMDAWKQRGNNYFKASHWFLAAFAYSQGLSLQPDAAVLLLNRAEAYLRLMYYSGALCDAQRVLSIEGIPDAHAGKALFRLAKAHYGRAEYAAAQKSFVRWKNTHAGDPAADPWIERCRARERERSSGEYDWPSLYCTARRNIRLDIAEYTGPVEVRTMSNRGGGRGVVATKELRAGDVLMVTKPFVSVYESDLPKDKMIISLDLISKTMKDRTGAVSLERIIDKIYGNPDLRDKVFHLYAGPDYMSPPSAYPPVSRDPVSVEPLNPKVDIDIAQLEAICTYNNFEPYRLETHGSGNDKATGLYPLASLFNHSCSPNAFWYCIGDVMIIRATGLIPAGTEITISYCGGLESYEDRQTALKKHMVEHCTCSLCEQDRHDGEDRLRKRHQLQEERVLPAVFSAVSLAEARTIEKDVRETYGRTRGPIRPLLAIALHAVAEKLRATGRPRQLREALQKDMEAFRCFGFEVLGQGGTQDSTGLPIGTAHLPAQASSNLRGLGDMMLRVAATYVELGEEANAVQWIKAALWLTKTCVGDGKELFLILHEAAMKQVNIYDYVDRLLR
ncbi:SET domain-containing protein [Lentinus brumalis]|uniref:SET domain-containing protein n=1 Tax=Lentinus brumalis TaxID=2498619 RepID=A0A371DWU4_9APHY|nr:SET domain-containing protein [Polyporus brumalis]